MHRRPLGHRVGGLLPDVVVGALSFWPNKLELEFAFVVFALVVERVQDTVVRVSGFRRIHAQPLVRWSQELGTGLTDQQRPRCRLRRCFLCCGRFCRLRRWLRCWGEVTWLHIMRYARTLHNISVSCGNGRAHAHSNTHTHTHKQTNTVTHNCTQ